MSTPNSPQNNNRTLREKVADAAAAVIASTSHATATLTPLQRFGSQQCIEDEKVRRFKQHKTAYQDFQAKSEDRRNEAALLKITESEYDTKIAYLERNGRAGEVAVAKREKAEIYVGKKELLAEAKSDIDRQERWDAFLALRSDEPGW